MSGAAIAHAPAPRGLGKLWAWIRRSILGPAAARQAPGAVTPIGAASEPEEETPLEPQGIKLRAAPPTPKPTSVFAPIRQGIDELEAEDELDTHRVRKKGADASG